MLFKLMLNYVVSNKMNSIKLDWDNYTTDYNCSYFMFIVSNIGYISY